MGFTKSIVSVPLFSYFFQKSSKHSLVIEMHALLFDLTHIARDEMQCHLSNMDII